MITTEGSNKDIQALLDSSNSFLLQYSLLGFNPASAITTLVDTPSCPDHECSQASEVWKPRASLGNSSSFPPPCSTTLLTRAIRRKYPRFEQNEIFGLQDAFRKLDVDDKGYLDEATAIKATQASERQPYDVVRQALKEVDLDSSRRVELDDYVDVCGAWVEHDWLGCCDS